MRILQNLQFYAEGQVYNTVFEHVNESYSSISEGGISYTIE
jgi:hypothetical protein